MSTVTSTYNKNDKTTITNSDIKNKHIHKQASKTKSISDRVDGLTWPGACDVVIADGLARFPQTERVGLARRL